MKIDSQDDGWFKFDDTDFQTLEDLIQTGILGFCGCGAPDENLEYIRRGLELIAVPYPEGNDWAAWNATRKASVQEIFGNDRSAYFFYYWCDKHRLTEHGGSVPGWLDEKGKKLLGLLNQWKASQANTGGVSE